MADQIDRADGAPPVEAHEVFAAKDFDSFARNELPRLLAYAVVLTGDRNLAADVVQDVMVRVHKQWSRVQGADRPELYVKRMVTNEYLSWRRRWHVRTVFAVKDDELHSRAPNTADHAGRVVDREDMWQRLAGLPRRQRAALVLRYYEDLDDAEIAELMQISPSTVRSNISRALASLRLEAHQEGTNR
jgi:RNA polymerase sigma-70 factor (sigma-E family)